jgi:hypothetical protein
MFYDQLWVNYVPVFYDNSYILKHPGYNMARWNLHERSLNANYCVNQSFPLRFFHFSGYNYSMPSLISSYNKSFNLNDWNDLNHIFESYNKLLLNNKVDIIFKLSVFYYPDLSKKKNNTKNNNLVIATIEKVFSRISKASKLLLYGKI